MSTFVSVEKLGISANDTEFSAKVNQFKPIGIGKPLVVRMHAFYPGLLDKNLLSGGQKSILITCMIKDDITHDIPQKGIIQIFRDVKSGKRLYATAGSEGAEVIYYARAFDENKLKFTIDVKLDKFNEKLLKDISGLLAMAKGIPVFAMYAPYAVLGSKLISIGGDFLNKVLNKDSLLTYNFDVFDNIAGFADSKSGWYIGVNDDVKDEFRDYQVVTVAGGSAYLAKDGKEYKGEHPYILCSVDGDKARKYEGYKVARASSVLLQEFYGDKEEKDVKKLGDIISIYNDYEYIKKIRDLEKLMNNNSEERNKEENVALLAAYKANINNEELQKIVGA